MSAPRRLIIVKPQSDRPTTPPSIYRIPKNEMGKHAPNITAAMSTLGDLKKVAAQQAGQDKAKPTFKSKYDIESPAVNDGPDPVPATPALSLSSPSHIVLGLGASPQPPVSPPPRRASHSDFAALPPASTYGQGVPAPTQEHAAHIQPQTHQPKPKQPASTRRVFPAPASGPLPATPDPKVNTGNPCGCTVS